jgi:hypothetical protein
LAVPSSAGELHKTLSLAGVNAVASFLHGTLIWHQVYACDSSMECTDLFTKGRGDRLQSLTLGLTYSLETTDARTSSAAGWWNWGHSEKLQGTVVGWGYGKCQVTDG